MRGIESFTGNGGGYQAGFIFLHGLGPSSGIKCKGIAISLGLSTTKTKVSCPLAPIRNAGILPGVFQPLGRALQVRSWFAFTKMPRDSVRANYGDPGEDKEQLEISLGKVEEEIEKMIDKGIPKENIVVAGASQVILLIKLDRF